MRTCATTRHGHETASSQHPAFQVTKPGFLYLVSLSEQDALLKELQRGQAPPDFQAKLDRLSTGDLIQRYVAKHATDFINLLLAQQHALFPKLAPADRERLLRVLAYVRKDDDAVPDYRPDGLVDDQQEVHSAVLELAPLIRTFKAWHLRHQVPALWAN